MDINQIRSEISKVLELSDIKINHPNFGWALMLMAVDILKAQNVDDKSLTKAFQSML